MSYGTQPSNRITRVPEELVDQELIDHFNASALDTKTVLIDKRREYAETSSLRLIRRARLRGEIERLGAYLIEIGHRSPIATPPSLGTQISSSWTQARRNHWRAMERIRNSMIGLVVVIGLGFLIAGPGDDIILDGFTTSAAEQMETNSEQAVIQAQSLGAVALAQEAYRQKHGRYTRDPKKLADAVDSSDVIEANITSYKSYFVILTTPTGWKMSHPSDPILQLERRGSEIIASCTKSTPAIPCTNGRWNANPYIGASVE